MEIKQLELKDLIPYANNPRKKQAIDKVASSIKEFGWQQPIVVDEANVIIVGHTRYQAAQKLGLDKAPVQVAKGLTDAQVKAYRILDNRANQDALWDDELLKIEVQDLDKMDIDLALTGFDDKELDKLLYEEKDGLTDEDAVPEDVEPKVKKGELWQLGNHRLLCGDATSEADVARLMQDKKADMIFTDPPYGVDYVSRVDVERRKDWGNIKNDELKGEQLQNFLKKSINWLDNTYIFCNWQSYSDFIKAFGKPKQAIVWNKKWVGLGKGYRNQYEICLFYGTLNITTETNLWELKRDTNYKHPTQKQVGLSERAIKNSLLSKRICFDPFAGSGSTLIGCEKTDRFFYGIEIERKYCDVIIKRWEDYTGQTAQLLERGTDTNSFKEDEQWQDQKNIKLTEKKSLN